MDKFLCQRERLLFDGCFLLLLSFFFLCCNESTIVYATRKNIIESVYASGKITAENEHTIFSLCNGAVIHKLIHEGDTIRANQILFEIKNITTKAGLKISQDKIQLLEQFGTSNDLHDKYYIRSDCNGIVYQIMKEGGEAVHMNEPVTLIGDAFKRIIRLAVDQQDIGKIKTGQQVLLKTDITGETIYTGTVTKVYNLMNESNQSFRVDAIFSDTFPHAFIHCPVEANIIVTKEQNALVLPRNAVDANDSVWTEKNGNKQRIKVRTGIVTGDYIQVLSGVEETTRIIMEQKNKLDE